MTLHVEGLDVHYGGVHAVRGVSLTVEDGEAIALIGSNGAGKTSILKAISGLVPASGGAISWRGTDITNESSHRTIIAGIGHVPEGRRLFPRMTVRENLLLGAFARKDSAVVADLEKQLTLFPRLAERISQQAGTLSGGEQQMVAISRALMSRPQLLLLDEPSLGLSPLLITTVFKAIADIHQSGTSLLLVEQNAVKALNLASRGYVISSGEILTSGSAAGLKADDRVREIYLGASTARRGARRCDHEVDRQFVRLRHSPQQPLGPS